MNYLEMFWEYYRDTLQRIFVNDISFMLVLVPFAYLLLIVTIIIGLFSKRIDRISKIILVLFYILYLLPGIFFWSGILFVIAYDGPFEGRAADLIYYVMLFVTLILPGIGIFLICRKPSKIVIKR